MYAAALAQDASAFDYDGVYDSLKASAQARPHRSRAHRAAPRC